MKVTCCPHYTIKCDVGSFKMSKSHKKIIKTVNRYLIHGIKRGDGKEDQEGSTTKGDKSAESEPKEEISGNDETMKESRKTPKQGNMLLKLMYNNTLINLSVTKCYTIPGLMDVTIRYLLSQIFYKLFF